ncbi:LPXTG cell wall anchor domain-containing protein [Aeromicrobium terrae]|uniref:LPXTG cell wall anchor domain-containing protein n=1 Tax=Aeromicrobium terrae TaxID=2498846 RepID=A0A5C8NNQ9_9ACTN|nr:LPXTG cell wall anchor domain-containing protein [Aeromicrobium terrae]TXL62730.1 LPXTG cell wall anchor domain-containing protein [Aeromicrobium terrae]
MRIESRGVLAAVLTVFTLVGAGLLAVASPAGAATANISAECTPDGNKLTVELSGYNSGNPSTVVLYINDSVFIAAGFFEGFSGSYSADPTIDVTWKVQVTSSDDPDGTTGATFTKTISVDACVSSVTPQDPTVTQAQCSGPGEHSDPVVTFATGPDHVTYDYDDATHLVTATAVATSDMTYRFDTVPAGWTKVDDTHATFEVTLTDPGTCIVEVTPTPPTVVPAQTCGDDVLNVPADTAGITYTRADDGSSVTATAGTGYELPGGARSQTWTNRVDYEYDTVANGGAEACPDPPGDPDDPGVSDSSGPAADISDSSGVLPDTGSSMTPVVLGIALALLVGGCLVVRRRLT